MMRRNVSSLAVLLVSFACASGESTSDGAPTEGEEPLIRLQEVARAERSVVCDGSAPPPKR